MTRVFYRQPVDSARRIGQPTLVHAIREDHPRYPGGASLCNLYTIDGSRALLTILDAMPTGLPADLQWCPTCIGKLAHGMGMLDWLARRLAEASREDGEEAARLLAGSDKNEEGRHGQGPLV